LFRHSKLHDEHVAPGASLRPDFAGGHLGQSRIDARIWVHHRPPVETDGAEKFLSDTHRPAQPGRLETFVDSGAVLVNPEANESITVNEPHLEQDETVRRSGR